MQALIQASHLRYGTPDGRILQSGLNFELTPGKLLLVQGSNGCGKTTLLRLIMGTLAPMAGDVKTTVSPEKVAYIPQLENTEVHMPLTLGDVLRASQREYTPTHALSFGLLDKTQLKAGWNTASGGERKRTLLTRILMQSPHLLVVDEPMNHLDNDSRAAMIQVMANFLNSSSSEDPKAIIMVCHQGLTREEAKFFDVETVNLDKAALFKGELRA